MQNEKPVEQLRAEHRAFSKGATPCAFFGFENDPSLEMKIYDFIDNNGDDWEYEQDAWDPLIDFFKKKKINNVSFSGQSGLLFHKIF